MPSLTTLVTGATQGIGRAICLTLADAGYRVGLCARTPGDVDAFVAELRGRGATAAGLAADVADASQVEAMVHHIEQTLGPVDVLVNNAGIARLAPFAELTLDDWDRTMATNLRGLFLVTRTVLPGMRERGRGTIINMASLAGRNGFVGGAAYSASKHAVLGFSRSLMLELRKEGIRVAAICPGSVATPLMEQQQMLDRDPERILRPEDVAASVLHVLSLPERALVSELDIRPSNP
jgi:3-oxoacyl-[acyl-carrier protein] reductase